MVQSATKNKRIIIYRTPRNLYYKIKRHREIYYKAKMRGSRICEPVAVSKDKLLNEIKRLKKLNNKSK